MATGNVTSYTTGTQGMVQEQVCMKFPPKVSSPGLVAVMLSHDKQEDLMDFSAPRLYFQMFVTFVLTESIHNILLKHLGLPKLISQILAGVILGPMVFKEHHSFITGSDSSVEILGAISSLGFLFFLFLSGVKMDPSMVYKAGRKAVFIGLLTVLMPVAFCLIADFMLSGHTDLIQNKNFFLSLTYSTTSFPVIHCLLSDLNILNSELGRLGLSAAIVSDIASMIVMHVGKFAKVLREHGVVTVFEDFALAFSYVAIVLFVLRPVMIWMAKRTPKGGKIKDAYVFAVIFVFLVIPKVTDVFYIFILASPFILGLAVPDGPPLGSALSEKLEPFVSGLFLPLFVSTCGMRIDLSIIQRITPYAKHQAIAAIVALLAKFFVSLLLPLLFKMPTGDSLALAFIMISKGIFEMGSYSILLDVGIISEDIFNIMVIIIVVLASIVPLMVRKFYDPSRKYLAYQKRSILHSKLSEDLRIIGCIHVPGDVNSIINMLNAFCPSRESPIALDVLHLVKLSGRSTPIFMAHDNNSRTLSSRNYSENVIRIFNQVERDNWEAVSVNIFTAVSPPKLMYEDICHLAMDRLTSFIVLPFHRRWNVDGSIESEDQGVRSLNCNILERAPCSVGIFIEGRRAMKCFDSIGSLSSDNSSGSIAVIFLGGKDDREALALARRIAQDQNIILTVYCLRAANNLGNNILGEPDKMLDDQMLKITKETGYVRYIEQEVNDGPETSFFLRSVTNDYQFIIVGRRYKVEDPRTSGLEEWSEFPEIGVLGDLLSSSDFDGHYSLLIVQQQQVNKA